MKTRKTNRLLSLLLALVMLVALAVPAFAAEDDPPEKELRMDWLDWDEEGRCYAGEGALDKNNGDGAVSGFGYDPTRGDAVIFFIWNNKTQKKESYVVPKAGDGMEVVKIDKNDIAPGAKQSSYYVYVRMNEFKDSEVTANGLSFKINAVLPDYGFYSAQTPSIETLLGHDENEETLAGRTLYFGNSYAGTDEAKDHDAIISVEKDHGEGDGHANLYTIEKVNDDCWRIVYEDVFSFQGDIWVQLKLEVKQPDGETREDYRSIRVYHDYAPELQFVWLNDEWTDMGEQLFYLDTERRDATGCLELRPGYPETGILGYGGSWEEDGFHFDGFTPVSVKDVKLPEGVTANTDLPAREGAQWSEYYVELSSDAKDQNFTVTYQEYELTISCRLPDIGVYTAPEAAWENWAGPWDFPFNAVLDDHEYYIISTASDGTHGRHLTDMALSAEWNEEDEEIANAGVELSKVSDGVYKLTLKDGALSRSRFHLELDYTWMDMVGNTWTDHNYYVGDFYCRPALVAGETALYDGTAEPAIQIPTADAVGKVSSTVTMTPGEDKVIYLYRSTYSGRMGPIVAHPTVAGYYHSANEELTLTQDAADLSKITLSADKAGVYEIYIGSEAYDWENLKLYHADGTEYTEEEWWDFVYEYPFDVVDGVFVIYDEETWEPTPFTELFPGETYELESRGLEEWADTRLTVVVEFTDLSPTGYYLDAVKWAMAKKVAKGTTDTTFSPKKNCTHGEILTFLWRAAGEPASDAETPFEMKGNEYYYGAAKWAYEMGMIDKDFNHKAPCTRADAVTYIWQAFGSPETAPASQFTDVAADAAYAQAVAWALDKGVTTGATDTTFNPNRVCNRGEIATFLYRAYTK